MRRAWIISIGTELTLGQVLDTNAAWLAKRLAPLGFHASCHLTIADSLADSSAAIQQAARAADLVIITGGLGPTDDDLTRQALADAAGVGLLLDESSRAQIEGFFAARGREMAPLNESQALVPETGTPLVNTCGTAPGLMIEIDGTPCYAVPGVPFEMESMFAREVEPRLRNVAGDSVILTRQINTYGMAEPRVGAAISDLMQRGRNPEIGTTAKLGVISLRMHAHAQSAADAEVLLDDAETQLRQRLGDAVFGQGDETLAYAVGRLLERLGQTLATAESCTGGLIGKLLTDVSGSSGYYMGGAVTYSNQAKIDLLGVPAESIDSQGAVSPVVASAMAAGAAARFGTAYGLSATGVAGPTGGTAAKPVGLVFIGLHTPAGTASREVRLGPDTPREIVRTIAAHTALNLLRLELQRA